MERRNAWLQYDEAAMEKVEAAAKGYKAYLDAGKTERECAEEAIRMAKEAGYINLEDAIKEGRMTGTVLQDAVGMAEATATIVANLISGADKFEGLAENVVIVDDWFVQIPYAPYTGE